MSGWDEQGRWRWGKAGERCDEREAGRRRAAAARRRFLAEVSRKADDERAQQLWAGGHLTPWRITLCLDEKGLYGPEVDIACGAAEPDVDLWEAGELYPTWEQVQKLAELCGVTPRFLMDDHADVSRIRWDRTTLRFHLPKSGEYDLVERFTPEAVRARLRPRAGESSPEERARYKRGAQMPLFDPGVR